MGDATAAAPLRTRVYIDGYNLYYGCLKSTSYKWLDLLSLFERHILPSILVVKDGHPLQQQLLPLAIKFFTAKILDQAAKGTDSISSQARYHSALRKRYAERIAVIEGYYSMIQAKMKIVDSVDPKKWPRDCLETTVWKLEEKQTDVNLALQAYHDAITGAVDHVVIVTNDTDIAPALALIRTHTQVTIGLVVPTTDQQRVPNTELAEQAHWVRKHITTAELAASQLPRVIKGRNPTIKPDSWYARPDLLEQVLSLATPVLGARGKAFKWMEEVNSYLGGRAPIDLVETDEGAAQVVEYIENYKAAKADKAVLSALTR